jgi:phosphatidate phosphatase LPIN
VTAAEFSDNRITFQQFVEDPSIVDTPDLVIKYGSRYVDAPFVSYTAANVPNSSYLTWQNASPVLAALAVYRRSLLPPTSPRTTALKTGRDAPASSQAKPSKGYAWSRWWRRGQSAGIPLDNPSVPPPAATGQTLQETKVEEPLTESKVSVLTKFPSHSPYFSCMR